MKPDRRPHGVSDRAVRLVWLFALEHGPAPLVRRRGKWRLPRALRDSDVWGHAAFYPTRRQLQYLEAYRRLLAKGARPTLSRLARKLGVAKQTVWQTERSPSFRKWLVTELRMWRTGYAYERRVDQSTNLRRRPKYRY